MADVRMRLPGSRTPIVLALKQPFPQLSARDTLTRWATQLKLRNPGAYTLVVAPTIANPLGEVVVDSAPMPNVLSALRPDDVLELWLSPGVVRVAWWDGTPNVRDPREVLLDMRSPLRHMLPLLQMLFGSQIGASDVSFHVTTALDATDRRFTKLRPLASFDSLRNQGVEPRTEGTCVMLSPLTVWERLPGAAVISPQREGYLMKQSIAKKKASQVQRRWFMLKDGHLFYYGARGDSSPKGVLVLEYWALTKPVPAERGISSFRLVRSYEGFASKHGSTYQLSGSDHEIRAWHEQLGPRCSNGASGTKVFGVELRELIARTDGHDPIPAIVTRVMAALESALDTEGLFRASGSLAHLEYLKDQFDQGGEPPLADMDALTLAQLLKSYLRDLPQPLLHADRYDDFLACVEGGGPVDQNRLVGVLSELSAEHLALLKHLCQFLNRVAQHAARNKMTPANLATCFAPSLLYRKMDGADDMAQAMKHAPLIASLVEALIANPDLVPVRSPAPSSPRQSVNPLSLSASALPDVPSAIASATAPASGWASPARGPSSSVAASTGASATNPQLGWRAGRARPVSPLPHSSGNSSPVPSPDPRSSMMTTATTERASMVVTAQPAATEGGAVDDTTVEGLRALLGAEIRARKALEARLVAVEHRLAMLEGRASGAGHF